MPDHHPSPTSLLHASARLFDEPASHLSPLERPLLIGALEATEEFRRDTALANVFRRGKISFREVCEVDSLHIIIDGNRVSAHVDEISPLRRKRDGSIGYSPLRVLVHNLRGLWADVGRRVRGVQGQQRCNLECEAVWVDDHNEVVTA